MADERCGEWTPLHSAAAAPSAAAAAALLERGADVHARSAWGMTPLAVLVRSSRCSAELVRALVRAGADVATLDFCGNTLLHQHAQSARPRPEILRTLLELGCDPLAANAFGNTALHVMAMYTSCAPSLLRPLLDAGVRIDARNEVHGTCCLHVAAGYGNTEGCLNLIAQGASLTLRSRSGRTPLASMLLHDNEVATAAALRTRPPAAAVAEALAKADLRRATAASRECVAYVVARAGPAALDGGVRRAHAALERACVAELAALQGRVCGTPPVTLAAVLTASNPPTVLAPGCPCAAPAAVRVYAEELDHALQNLRRKSQLVYRLKKEVCPCALPEELVEAVLSRLTVEDLLTSCGIAR
ncbi:ankyrin repeat protein [Equine parapoxvirus]|nr:ankyrin repeat protein [Equine parapoxvirus]WOC35550.1 ankyrin repeat protein [Equine parapoxvirus]